MVTKSILLLSIAFSPNIGGIETHFDDLVGALAKRGWKVLVLTYQPLETKTMGKWIERRNGISIFRLPIIRGVFNKLVKNPFLEFLYLVPGLFLTTPFFLLGKKINLIHAQGLVGGFVGVFWGKLFGKRVITSTHSIYHFPQKGFYRNFARWIFNMSDFSMGLSKQAAEEIKSLGIPKEKVGVFTYWIDLDKFVAISNKQEARNKLGWREKFSVLFVGRLIPEKGIHELLEAAKMWDKNITLVIAGSGPLEEKINHYSLTIDHLLFLGKVTQEELPLYYSAADLLIVPSTHEEGFGRVILEALACGTPVIGARRGAIPEAMNETVGKLIDVTPENIKTTVEYFYNHPKELNNLSKNTRRFAERRYGEANIETIIRAYTNG